MTIYLVMQTPWATGNAEVGGVFLVEAMAQAAIDERDPRHSWYSIQSLTLDELTPEEPTRPKDGYYYNPGKGREEVSEEAWIESGGPPA